MLRLWLVTQRFFLARRDLLGPRPTQPGPWRLGARRLGHTTAILMAVPLRRACHGPGGRRAIRHQGRCLRHLHRSGTRGAGREDGRRIRSRVRREVSDAQSHRCEMTFEANTLATEASPASAHSDAALSDRPRAIQSCKSSL